MPGKVIKLSFSTSPKTLSPRFDLAPVYGEAELSASEPIWCVGPGYIRASEVPGLSMDWLIGQVPTLAQSVMTMTGVGKWGCTESHGTKYGAAFTIGAEGRGGSLRRNYGWGRHLIYLEVVEGRASD